MRATCLESLVYIACLSLLAFRGPTFAFSYVGFTSSRARITTFKHGKILSGLHGNHREMPASSEFALMLVPKMSSSVEDDGYSRRFGKVRGKFRSGVKSVFTRVFRGKPKPGTLILVRHGETVWNYNSTFTGWIDVDLSPRGRREMEHAGRLLLERGYDIDVTYTSRLKRAIRSSWILLQELNQIYRPVYKSFRLNERMYGAFEGLSKPMLAQGMGKEAIQAVRTELDRHPPKMSPNHPYWHGNEKKYADLDPSDIPDTESLQDTMDRTLPLWKTRIRPELEAGNNVMVVAHGHSLRGLVRHIDCLTAEQIQIVGIPNGIPLVSACMASIRLD